jgi:hypothetical protein
VTGEQAAPGQRRSGGFVAGLAPWIVYWILVGNVDFRLAVLIAFGVALFELVRAYPDYVERRSETVANAAQES